MNRLHAIGRSIAAVLVVGCGSPAPTVLPTGASAAVSTPATFNATASPTSDVVREPGVLRGHFDVAGASMWIECLGTGSPTVVLDTGLGGTSNNWIDQQQGLSATTRVCRYDRSGIGQSIVQGITTISAGTRAEELHALLEAAEIDGPYVLAGWSFGGMIARLFAARYPADTAGLVFLDASHEDQFTDPWWTSVLSTWSDGGSRILDFEASRTELLAATNLGATPTIVLSSGDANGDFERHWAPLQDALATMSTASVHMVAARSGHDINSAQPELVRKAVEAVTAAVRTGGLLPACAGTFDVVGATCLDGTLVERLAAWDAIRATVQAQAGGFPDGTYRMELTGDQFASATGEPADFTVAIHTWTVAGGRWKVSIVIDGVPEAHEGVYEVDGRTMTFLLSDDWRIPGTPGVNDLEWAVDAKGTITFNQLDDYAVEPSFVAPWVRTGDAPGG